MIKTVDQLMHRLQSALGPDAVSAETDALASHRIDGLTPHLVTKPASAEQVGAVVAIGSIAAGRLWWKSRGINPRNRDNPTRGLVLEGEVIREVREHDDRSH